MMLTHHYTKVILIFKHHINVPTKQFEQTSNTEQREMFSPPLGSSILKDASSIHTRGHSRAVMHVGIAKSWWRGKRSRLSRRMRNSQFYVSGKRPIAEAPGFRLFWIKPSFTHSALVRWIGTYEFVNFKYTVYILVTDYKNTEYISFESALWWMLRCVFIYMASQVLSCCHQAKAITWTDVDSVL